MPIFYPLGFPAQIEAFSPEVVDAASESWALRKQIFDARPIRLDVVVKDGDMPGSPPRMRATRSTIELLADARNHANFDCDARSGLLVVSRGVVKHRDWFRYHLLDAIVLTALDMTAFTPVHAACVARSGHGLLLCGDSGSGKSSLAYACTKRGWSFISDDAVHIVRGGRGVVVGNPHKLHLRAGALTLFPEISGTPATRQPNGKLAIEVPVTGSASDSATVAACVFLSRRATNRAELVPLNEGRAREYFRKYIFWGDRRVQELDFDCILQNGCWELRYGELGDAIGALGALVS